MAQNTTNRSATAAAIEKRSRRFEENFAAHNAERLVADYFVPDAMNPLASGPGGGAPVKGRDNLRGMFTAQFSMFTKIRLETYALEDGTEQAFELGRAHLTLKEGGNALGRYTVLWVNTDDGWRAKIDFFAADGWTD